MWFAILGPTELHVGGKAVPLGAAKQRGLLAVLLLYAGKPVAVDRLTDHLWPDGGTVDRRQTLYSMVSRLRSVLDRSGVEHELARVGAAYRLDVDPATVDFHQFRTLVEQARTALGSDRPVEAESDLVRAVGLWRGDAVADLRGSAAEHLRRQITEALVDAHRLLADARLRTGRHHAVLVQLEELVREYDVDESLARLWISALCAVRREDDARRYLAQFRKRFRRELGAEPCIDLDVIRARPPYGADARPRQLPYGIPGFVGHEDLLTELDRLAEPGVDRPHGVIITGMPGVGKTTLAVHWSQRRAGLFPDGQLFLDAGAFGPGEPIAPGEALAHFLHALGVPEERIPAGSDDRRHRFNEVLAGRRVLVFIDNAADSAQVRPLIPAVPTCLAIITSRRRLNGLTVREGVHQFVGQPLGEAEAGALLTQFVGARRAAAEPAAVSRLAAMAGGLPLALRIVGVQVAERPRAGIAELAAELRDRLLWARAEDDDLSTVFAWSYRSLPAEAARVFRLLALHPGARISLDAAAALAGADARETMPILDLLARMNLVEHDTARHYRLHDLLRQFAGAMGQAEDPAAETDAARAAVLTWFLRSATNAAALLSPQLPPVPDLPPAPPGVMEFATEGAAMAWCRSERQNLATAVQRAVRHGLHRHAWQIPAAVHDLFTRTGRYDDLVQMNQIGAESARRDGHAYGEIANLSNAGYAYCGLHQFASAIAPLTAARARAAEAGDPAAESVCAHNLGSAYLNLGDTGRAVAIYQEVRAISRRLGNQFGEAATLHRLGDAYRREGRPALALAAYREALRLRTKIGAERSQALTHTELSRFHLGAGHHDLAHRHCAAALAVYDRIEDPAGACDALITRADIARAEGSAFATVYAETAVAAAADLGDSFRHAEALAVLADALAGAGSLAAAIRVRAEGLALAAQLSGPDAAPLRERLRTTTSVAAPDLLR
ncbi:AfsR/SARP family transcriptional regulator [Jidongwangia harbinensis]|uniref:AfsR/SARP family transcriptional regulator n=1 Tax=Jidongwangia harbinensis TaxID=2878561 RepID=UPI001CD923BE|nr:BTAD domain-containing putative transcriptional regulator [Jidongwangia harbinensis]MCA2211435.1 tetratricopeptide repeat protein [Jidongwangia harbinensis]